MIVGSIQNLEADKPALAKALIKGLEYLKSTDFSKVELGRYEIDGKALFALVQEYQTVPKSEKRAEAHHKYLDIQYIFQGAETIGFGMDNADNPVSEDKLEEKDNIFFGSVKDEMDLVLTQGMYAVFFPKEVHRPGCHYGNGGTVRKVVVKISKDLL